MASFSKAVLYLSILPLAQAFAPANLAATHKNMHKKFQFQPKLQMAGGEGGETEWAKALMDNVGTAPGQFDKEMQAAMKGKMSGLNPNASKEVDGKISANARLVKWLEEEGDVEGKGEE